MKYEQEAALRSENSVYVERFWSVSDVIGSPLLSVRGADYVERVMGVSDVRGGFQARRVFLPSSAMESWGVIGPAVSAQRSLNVRR